MNKKGIILIVIIIMLAAINIERVKGCYCVYGSCSGLNCASGASCSNGCPEQESCGTCATCSPSSCKSFCSSHDYTGGHCEEGNICGSSCNQDDLNCVCGSPITTSTTTSCFLAGTPIALSDGTEKPIEDIKVGDVVLSYDERTKTNVPSKVEKTHHHPKEQSSSYLIINNRLRVTPNHPVLVNNKWKRIDNANIGNILRLLNGNNLIITSIRIVYDKVPSYNLEIENTHTYYAGNVLVHNKGITSTTEEGGAGSTTSTTTSDDPCFLAGTPIALSDGTEKPIEDIKVGDIVLSYDEETQANAASIVKKTLYHPKEQSSSYLIINNRLRVTPNHPILVNNKWKRIGNADIGNVLRLLNGNNLIITSIRIIYGNIPTYNFEVENTHTYYAGDILVHNGWGSSGKEPPADESTTTSSTTSEGETTTSTTCGGVTTPKTTTSTTTKQHLE